MWHLISDFLNIFSESIFPVLLYGYVAENFVHYQPKCQIRSIYTFNAFGLILIRSILNILVTVQIMW